MLNIINILPFYVKELENSYSHHASKNSHIGPAKSLQKDLVFFTTKKITCHY